MDREKLKWRWRYLTVSFDWRFFLAGLALGMVAVWLFFVVLHL
jgi:hypothetical protein